MTRASSITTELRRDILEGQFPPGERLLEIPLAERYGCGRASVRAALLELASEGIVDREANRGASVRRISIEEAIQITEARAALESLIAANAAQRANEADRRELTDIVARMRTAVEADAVRDYSDLNALLHRRLREIARHGVAADLVENLRNRAAHHQYRLALMPGRPTQSLQQHIAIVEAVVAGDRAAAHEAMAEHLESVAETLHRWAEVPGMP
jgi:DNA-binding GntR family transcriptional regulator